MVTFIRLDSSYLNRPHVHCAWAHSFKRTSGPLWAQAQCTLARRKQRGIDRSPLRNIAKYLDYKML